MTQLWFKDFAEFLVKLGWKLFMSAYLLVIKNYIYII